VINHGPPTSKHTIAGKGLSERHLLFRDVIWPSVGMTCRLALQLRTSLMNCPRA
jgi:hypothetical protein